MGCDIHMFVERNMGKDDDPYWWLLAELNLDRDYLMFAILAGVRNEWGTEVEPVSMPKGVPDDLGWITIGHYILRVDDAAAEIEGYCSRKDADLWLRQGISQRWQGDSRRITNPDAHSASWLSYDELTQAERRYCELSEKLGFRFTDPNPDLSALVVLMGVYEEQRPGSMRAVFWFDN